MNFSLPAPERNSHLVALDRLGSDPLKEVSLVLHSSFNFVATLFGSYRPACAYSAL